MGLLAIVKDSEHAEVLLHWAAIYSIARNTPLTVLCWSYSPIAKYPLLADAEDLAENDKLVEQTRLLLDKLGESLADFEAEKSTIQRAIDADCVAATIAEIRAGDHQLVVGFADQETIETDVLYGDEPLLHLSPIETVLFYREGTLPTKTKKIAFVSADSAHDQTILEMLGNADRKAGIRLTLARLEEESGPEAVELGRREVKRMIRNAGCPESGISNRCVFSRNDWPAFVKTANENHLIVVGANQQHLLRRLTNYTTKPGIAAVKRAPPLKRLSRMTKTRWQTMLSPADYADMMQGLRHGAELNADFLIMLGLAAAIASLGLLQDSPAVVIGSMLLAPLMTPMIACGLAIAQGNMKLGRRSMVSIGIGFLLTLSVSFVMALIAPGEEITMQIIARGNPNMLDLLIALLSAAAAAYALARPNVIGAVAGVAIATALVPPLCSAGISLAYGEFLNAQGAALLFVTNLVAIIVGAAITFRLLGVTFARVGSVQRRWVYRITTIMGVTLILLAIPLQRSLDRLIELGKPQPVSYPLTKSVDDALWKYLRQKPGIEIVASGRPSSLFDRADVVIVLSAPEPIDRDFAEGLVDICRTEMSAPELAVEIHCFLNAWQPERGEVPGAILAIPDEE
ncbi:MAG: TIGR00341 family protein [Rubripirellula sp.]